jgi:hypothetical protein
MTRRTRIWIMALGTAAASAVSLWLAAAARAGITLNAID